MIGWNIWISMFFVARTCKLLFFPCFLHWTWYSVKSVLSSIEIGSLGVLGHPTKKPHEKNTKNDSWHSKLYGDWFIGNKTHKSLITIPIFAGCLFIPKIIRKSPGWTRHCGSPFSSENPVHRISRETYRFDVSPLMWLKTHLRRGMIIVNPK